jgi:excisionase family DNA binding protein
MSGTRRVYELNLTPNDTCWYNVLVNYFVVNMTEIKANEVYTTAEAEKLLKISNSTMKRMLKHGLIRANKIGKQYRILGHELLRLLSPEVDANLSNAYGNFKRKIISKVKDW